MAGGQRNWSQVGSVFEISCFTHLYYSKPAAASGSSIITENFLCQQNSCLSLDWWVIQRDNRRSDCDHRMTLSTSGSNFSFAQHGKGQFITVVNQTDRCYHSISMKLDDFLCNYCREKDRLEFWHRKSWLFMIQCSKNAAKVHNTQKRCKNQWHTRAWLKYESCDRGYKLSSIFYFKSMETSNVNTL